MASPQSFKNHTRRDFAFMIPMMVLALNVAVTVWWYARHFSEHRNIGAWLVLLSMAAGTLGLRIRTYALRNQDRIIGLEERARLAALISPAELIELSSLTNDQMVGLRFASTAELPDLARRAVREQLTRKQIKESIVSWRPDNQRI